MSRTTSSWVGNVGVVGRAEERAGVVAEDGGLEDRRPGRVEHGVAGRGGELLLAGVDGRDAAVVQVAERDRPAAGAGGGLLADGPPVEAGPAAGAPVPGGGLVVPARVRRVGAGGVGGGLGEVGPGGVPLQHVELAPLGGAVDLLEVDEPQGAARAGGRPLGQPRLEPPLEVRRRHPEVREPHPPHGVLGRTLARRLGDRGVLGHRTGRAVPPRGDDEVAGGVDRDARSRGTSPGGGSRTGRRRGTSGR